ncbi:response regulator transcription factor [Stackebrandtia nassauensis]|uniref:Two component transcriptional regulator, LuxR family n=1 Tax=Stackebrandtia nassauensis (strain DSM 44728 / CIP 108903 / NRRL B-16338 / NBRC 102104 / LLR-40K-21) TaxID=446470 RepID=D3Q747_STANL|nr:response regulator transcription factor [Stackebrandtia nassauensis]ADD42318.1 two component transcriptional regulator, LuxR family [Stackebrandtia nassauensis DSM 44728]
MRVVIVEDDALLRRGLTLLLESEGFEVAASTTTAEEFLEAVDRERPDIAVVDVRLPPTFRDEGLRAAVEARRRHRGLPVLVLSAHVEHDYATQLLSDGDGRVGYLLKERVGKVEEFLDAIRRVVDGGAAIDPEVISQLLAGQKSSGRVLGKLSAREHEVLGLMAEGYGNGSIAATLVITETAVSKHIRNIFAKLDLPQSETGHRRVLAVLAYLQASNRFG